MYRLTDLVRNVGYSTVNKDKSQRSDPDAGCILGIVLYCGAQTATKEATMNTIRDPGNEVRRTIAYIMSRGVSHEKMREVLPRLTQLTPKELCQAFFGKAPEDLPGRSDEFAAFFGSNTTYNQRLMQAWKKELSTLSAWALAQSSKSKQMGSIPTFSVVSQQH